MVKFKVLKDQIGWVSMLTEEAAEHPEQIAYVTEGGTPMRVEYDLKAGEIISVIDDDLSLYCDDHRAWYFAEAFSYPNGKHVAINVVNRDEVEIVVNDPDEAQATARELLMTLVNFATCPSDEVVLKIVNEAQRLVWQFIK